MRDANDDGSEWEHIERYFLALDRRLIEIPSLDVLADEAMDQADFLGLPTDTNNHGIRDAYRHVYAASRLGEKYGGFPTIAAGLVKEIADFFDQTKEAVKGNGNTVEKLNVAVNAFVMDVRNNNFAKSPKQSPIDIFFTIAAGEVVVLDDHGTARFTGPRDVGGYEWNGIDVRSQKLDTRERIDHDFGDTGFDANA